MPDNQHVYSTQPISFIEKVPINGKIQRVAIAEIQPEQTRILQCITELSRSTGGFRVFGAGPLLRACIQFSAISDVHGARIQVLQLCNQLVGLINTMSPALASGGGCKSIEAEVRTTREMGPHLEIAATIEMPDRSDTQLIDILIAKLTPLIEQLTNGTKIGTSISEIAGRQLLCAQVTFDPSSFSLAAAPGYALAGRIVDLHNFTCKTKERVGVHNAAILATANSVLGAVGAAGGSNGSKLSTWKAHDDAGAPLVIWYRDHHGHLAGRISLPVLAEQADSTGAALDVSAAQVAIAANVTYTHPLNPAVAAIGLARSLASLHTHAAEAISQGDPGQHAYDLALLVGASDGEIVHVVKALLSAHGVRSDLAMAALDKLRGR